MSKPISDERAALPGFPTCFTWSDEHARRLWDEDGMREYAQAAIVHESEGAAPYGYIHHFAPERRPHDPIPVFSRLPKLPDNASDFPGEVIEITPLYTAAPVAVPVDASNRKLSVWYGSMPESNGKTNWTAILHAGDIAEGITLDRSEYPDCVRYEADRARYLIGEIDKAPFILDYDADKHSGYSAPAPHSGEAAISDDSARIQDYAEQNMLTLEEAADELRSAPRHDRVPAIGEAGGVVAEPVGYANQDDLNMLEKGGTWEAMLYADPEPARKIIVPVFAAQPQAAPIIDTDAATRLRGLCSDLGVPACSVPQGDAELLACLFSLLGSIRFRVRELKAAPSGLSDAQIYERCARACEKRAEERFAECGTREPDTGATYYSGRAAEELNARDEEDDSCAADIRALAAAKATGRGA